MVEDGPLTPRAGPEIPEQAPRRRNRRGEGGLLGEQLVAAATTLLAELDTPESLTLRMIARDVGIAPASVYRHFADLSALVDHVLRLMYEDLTTTIQNTANQSSTPLEDLVARCVGYVHWGLTNPGHYRVVFGGRTPPDLSLAGAHGAGATLLGDLASSLSRAKPPAGQHFAEVSADTDATAQLWQAGLLIWTALHGIVSLVINSHNVPWPPMDELLTRLIALHTSHPTPTIRRAYQKVAPPIERPLTPGNY